MAPIRRHFEQELHDLNGLVLRLGGHAESAIAKAMKALVERDVCLARQVVKEDDLADQLEVQIDELCVQVLARHQLVGPDLRFVTSALKVAPDLERIGDLATNVAQRVIDMLGEPRIEQLFFVPNMASHATAMLRQALDAFVQRDPAGARAVIGLDESLDAWMEQTYLAGVAMMQAEPAHLTRVMRVLMIAKSLERIGDNVTNVCEMVVWMIDGETIRHRELEA